MSDSPLKISVVLSSFNEKDNAIFWRNLELLRHLDGIELVIIDGGSEDGTVIKMAGLNVYHLSGSQRSSRYNLGIEQAKGDWIVLVHPRTELVVAALEELQQLPAKLTWGAFRHSFDWEHPLLKFTSWYSNFVRGRLGGVFYLDHCLFLSRDLINEAHFPEVAVFEDTRFCRRLRKKVWPRLLLTKLVTSAIRFRKNGVWFQALLNQSIKILFHLGVSDEFINRFYEKGLTLNGPTGRNS
jgi:glycosyltransferase involved in cell wall biosynthesis